MEHFVRIHLLFLSNFLDIDKLLRRMEDGGGPSRLHLQLGLYRIGIVYTYVTPRLILLLGDLINVNHRVHYYKTYF